MGRLLASGEQASIFTVPFTFKDEAEIKGFQEAPHIFDWVIRCRAPEERDAVIAVMVFPAILSDMLHCIYETLETSRKAKLNVSYMLLRKPLQESLYVLEGVIKDRRKFSDTLAEEPIKLWSQGAGGRAVHVASISAVLEIMGNDGRFDADYLAQLRYDKSSPDGFDGICNKAIHLFTSHKAIATEQLNINFIFSSWESKESQWAFIYSRLPYVLAYTYQIVEQVCATISKTTPEYLYEIQRRIAAFATLWGPTIEGEYREPHLDEFVSKNKEWLDSHCAQLGFRSPNEKDLYRMISTGALPGESRWALWRRMRRFQIGAEASKSTKISKLSKIQTLLGLRPLI